MSSIPLDLQRRFERRWAARFLRPDPPTAPQKHQLERQDQLPGATRQGRKKNPPGSAGGLQVPQWCERGTEAPRALVE
jgi:hypothetical protein